MTLRRITSGKNEDHTATIGGRLHFFLNKNKLLAADLAKATGVHQTTVGNYLSGMTSPKKDFLLKLEEVFRLSAVWVDYGVGPMYVGDNEQKTDEALHEEASLNYEEECRRLKNELAETILASAKVQEKLTATERRSFDFERLLSYYKALAIQNERKIDFIRENMRKAIEDACAVANFSQEQEAIMLSAVENYEARLSKEVFFAEEFWKLVGLPIERMREQARELGERNALLYGSTENKKEDI